METDTELTRETEKEKMRRRRRIDTELTGETEKEKRNRRMGIDIEVTDEGGTASERERGQ